MNKIIRTFAVIALISISACPFSGCGLAQVLDDSGNIEPTDFYGIPQDPALGYKAREENHIHVNEGPGSLNQPK